MKLSIPAGEFRGYLFDCDGTIADSMPLHYNAWTRALKEWNCRFDEELFYRWGGKPVREVIAELNRIEGLEMPVEAVAESKERYYKEQLPELRPIPEILEIVQERHRKIPLAVVSGSKKGLGCLYAPHTEDSRQIRNTDLCGGLQMREAGSRWIFVGGKGTPRSTCGMSCLRGHGFGNPGRNRGGDEVRPGDWC